MQKEEQKEKTGLLKKLLVGKINLEVDYRFASVLLTLWVMKCIKTAPDA